MTLDITNAPATYQLALDMDDEDAEEDGPDAFFIEKSISHRINRSRNQKYAYYGKTLYRERW